METLTVILKISLVIFMAGNLMEMGLKLNPANALRGLKDTRFVVLTLVWGFVLGPAVAYLITLVIPLEQPYAIGLILLGMTPCAPFVPMIVGRANGDHGYAAAFMLLCSVGTIVFMPFGVPLLVEGLTVSLWSITKPLLVMILIPLMLGMAILRSSPALAGKLQSPVKKLTVLATLLVFVLSLIVYGKGLLGVAGSFAIASQCIFFFVITAFSWWLGFGLGPDRKIVLSAGIATRNLGAALAPLFSAAAIDQRAVIMVVLGLPIMTVFALGATRFFGKSVNAQPPVSDN